ncbi:serine/threonine-protein kinase [Embleya hyalina]|uniref:Serine/threonine protein kinase n=1 Tax=Embleya hyalina TaxID=516124 RepID=A0A401YNP8_9ACTN|nr:serine/threonine-protein kinase [Embleya hyalina]GCD96139.1 serine/threonine protein kinase [Embleya hyalina]
MNSRFAPLSPDDPHTAGGYVLRARLGAGGMGRVYLSFTPGGRALAIKVVRPDFADDATFRRRFRQEVAAAQRVQGLYTVPVVDSDTDAAVPWMATAYVPGPSLSQAVEDHGPLPPVTVFRLLAGVAEGLDAVHACNVIHRDLKPANVLLAQDGPRVIDFGIARAADASSVTGTGASVGTPAFMAPEQIRGRSATPALDVFALGNLVVYAATGHTAFGEGHRDALFHRILMEPADLDGCPVELRDMVTRCLTKDPAGRPTLAEVLGFARKLTERETIPLPGSWLPAEIVASFTAHDTARFTATRDDPPPDAGRRVAARSAVAPAAVEAGPAAGTAPRPGQTADKVTPVPGGGESGVGGKGVLAVVAVVAAVAFLAIGPEKVLDTLRSSASPTTEAAPRATVPVAPHTTEVTPQAPSSTPPVWTPTAKATPTGPKAGCEQAHQAIKTQNGRTQDVKDAKKVNTQQHAFADDLDKAALEATDPELRRVLHDFAADARAMGTNYEASDAAAKAGNAQSLSDHQAAFSTASDKMSSDLARYQSLCR